MILNDLILSLTDCTREAVNDPCLHFDNRTDSVENKVAYIVTERTSYLTGSYVTLVFNQIDSSLWLYKVRGFFILLFFRFFTPSPLIQTMTLSLNVLNALLAFSLIGSGMWFINQSYHSLSLSLTCGRFLIISCRSTMSISCELDCLTNSSSCPRNSGHGGLRRALNPAR